ncbi:hypothetical protein FSP39_003479 [Pinctada imbricata]|uniref:CUB domain-containing protein n=1 Tax=Pinctada imbricata TaxID=66713 RepID=A0AA88YGS5_PINIB|nr:hypothetical protein FSP39_003479 [Pinctada imbricata]
MFIDVNEEYYRIFKLIIFYTSNKAACTQEHRYSTDSEYLVRANGEVTGSRCELSFLESTWSEDILAAPCISLCIRITNYSLGSCDFEMIYNDGLGDLKPKKFNCHTFPPLLWCSTKNDLKIEFVELKKYKGEGYDITLEVKPICGASITPGPTQTSGESYRDRYFREEKKQRDTVIITGSLVSTVSFLFVIFWIVYCCWKRKNNYGENSSRNAGSNTQNTAVKSAAGPSTTVRKVPWYPMHEMPTQGCGPPAYTEHHYETRYTEMPTNSQTDKDQINGPYENRQSPAKDHIRYHDDHPTHHFTSGSQDYDADEEMSYMNHPSNHHQLPVHAPPPLPPRPNMINPNSKQYFV